MLVTSPTLEEGSLIFNRSNQNRLSINVIIICNMWWWWWGREGWLHVQSKFRRLKEGEKNV